MKIIDKFKKIEFAKLDVGATFKYESAYYIKTHRVKTNDSEYNAVDLYGGEHEYFSHEDEVIPFNCELIVL